MRLARLSLLPALLWLGVACGGAESPAEATAEPASAEVETPAAAKPPPRDYAVVWPEVLARRDRIRELMAVKELWHEEMKAIMLAIEEMYDLYDEMHDLAKAEGKHGAAMAGVRIGVGDVKIATSALHAVAAAGQPGKFPGKVQAIDWALRSLQSRFPQERLGPDVEDRPDFGQPVDRRNVRRGDS